MPIAVRAFLRPPPLGPVHGEAQKEAPPACVVPLVLTAAACVALFAVPDMIIGPVGRALELP
jgi:multicomponent Na+:H+ antiporter subunit D